jgi:endonuclease/exonuclease/phosphatase family metal-dependent hydrolase
MVLTGVLQAHRGVRDCLQSGRQRLRQTRELLRVESALLAHACLLLGDLGRDAEAAEYGTTSLALAREAGVSEATARAVQAKTARWQGKYIESAELARRGFEVSEPSPVKAELAYREANAIALFGDASRA